MSEETARAAVDRGRRAQLAYDEFVLPAIEAMDAAYFERMKLIVSSEPWDVERIKALVMAQRIVEGVKQQLQGVIVAGKAAQDEISRIEKLNSMSMARRRALGL